MSSEETSFYEVASSGGLGTPRFSLVIVSFNRPELLAACLSALAEQEGSHKAELIVVDNGSTAPIAWDDVALGNFASVSLFRRDKNVFSVDPWVFAVSRAQGEFILLPGDDDLPRRNYLSTFDDLVSVEGCTLAAAGMRHVDAEGRSKGVFSIPPGPKSRGEWAAQLLSFNPFSMPATAFARRSVDLSRAPSTRFALDWWIWNIAAAAGLVCTSPEVVIDYRVHKGQERHGYTPAITGIEGARALTSVIEDQRWLASFLSLSPMEIEAFCQSLVHGGGLNHGEPRWSGLLQMRVADHLRGLAPPEQLVLIYAQALGLSAADLDLSFIATAVGFDIAGSVNSELFSMYEDGRVRSGRNSNEVDRSDLRYPVLSPLLALVGRLAPLERLLYWVNHRLKHRA